MLVVRVMSPGRSLGSCNELNRSSCAVSCRAGCEWSAGLLRDRAPNVLSHPLLSYCCPCLLLLDCEIFVCIVSGVVVCLWLLAPTPAGAGGIDPLPRILCLPADALPVVGESAGAPALAQLLLALLAACDCTSTDRIQDWAVPAGPTARQRAPPEPYQRGYAKSARRAHERTRILIRAGAGPGQ